MLHLLDSLFTLVLIAVFNLIAWCVEVAGDCMALSLRSSHFLLGLNLATLLTAGITPIIYLLGAQAYMPLVIWLGF